MTTPKASDLGVTSCVKPTHLQPLPTQKHQRAGGAVEISRRITQPLRRPLLYAPRDRHCAVIPSLSQYIAHHSPRFTGNTCWRALFAEPKQTVGVVTFQH